MIVAVLSARPAMAMATNARALAMGNAYSVVANEADMAAWNPALLGLHQKDDHWLELTAPAVNLGLGNNFLSLQDLLAVLPDAKGNPQTLTPATISGLLGDLPASGWNLVVDSGVRAALASRPLETSLEAETDVDVQGLGLPHDLVQFLLEGNTNTPTVDISALQGATATAIAAAGLSHAFSFPNVLGKASALGVTVKYLQGLAYGTVTEATGSVLSRDALGQLSASASLEYEAAVPKSLSGILSTGSGLAVDLGFVNQVTDELRWGMTLGNLGFIKWNNVQDRVASVNQAPIGAGLGLSGQPALPNFSNDIRQTAGASDGQSNV
ncbi:MAG: hypothetical protein KGR26_09050, partial [Cyanobacteria bacterium REEB65]|nr:hypothetical protein [Cyanobacteria bacterium REEB65]